MRARPAGPAQSSVFHDFARRGPTKETHRRALNRPDGLLRSVAGRLTSANRPRPAPTAPSPPEGPIKGGVEGPIKGGSRDPWRDPSREVPRCQQSRQSGPRASQNYSPQLPVAAKVRGPGSASARPGPCTRPRSADALTQREIPSGPKAPGLKLVRPRPPTPASSGRPEGGAAAGGRSSLTPG